MRVMLKLQLQCFCLRSNHQSFLYKHHHKHVPPVVAGVAADLQSVDLDRAAAVSLTDHLL